MAWVTYKNTAVTTVVKYFKEQDYKYYQTKKFKWGTLAEYRSYENEVLRLSDHEEGTMDLVVPFIPVEGRPDVYTHPPIVTDRLSFIGNTFSDYIGEEPDRIRGIVSRTELNAHIMCFSIGTYSKNHHKNMMYGKVNSDSSAYRGDPTLTMAAEIDLVKFQRSLGFSVKRDQRIFGLPVIYGDRRIPIDTWEFGQQKNKISFQRMLKAIFTKKPVFEAEREYRLIMCGINWTLPNNISQPILFSSQKLASAVTNFYQVKDHG